MARGARRSPARAPGFGDRVRIVGIETGALGVRGVRVGDDLRRLAQHALVANQDRRGRAAAGAPGRKAVDHLEVGALLEADARAIERPARLLAVVADRNRDEDVPGHGRSLPRHASFADSCSSGPARGLLLAASRSARRRGSCIRRRAWRPPGEARSTAVCWPKRRFPFPRTTGKTISRTRRRGRSPAAPTSWALPFTRMSPPDRALSLGPPSRCRRA